MKKIKYVPSVILAIAMSCAACDGPEGPVGPQGPQGEQGTAGQQGLQGEPGTANVMYSEWMDFDWNLSDNTFSKSMYIEEPLVLEDFMDTGTILVYLKQEVGGLGKAITLLPYIEGTNVLHFVIADVPSEDLAGIVIALNSTDGSTVTSNWSDYQVRYVLVPGGVLLRGGRLATIDYSDYEAVKAYYGIPD